MRRTEPELVAVRELAEDMAGSYAGEPSTARTWAKIVNAQSSDATAAVPVRLSRRREWLAVATVAAAVVALAVTATAVLRPGPGPATQVGGTAPSPVPTAAPSVPTDKQGDPWSTPAPGTEAPTIKGTLKIRPVSLAKAIDAMSKAAKNSPAVTAASGQFLYTRIDAFDRAAGKWVPRTQDLWTALSVKKPSVDHPTPAYLASLTRDPARLYDKFAAINAGVKLGGERYVTKELFGALRQYGPIMKPDLRAAYYKVPGLVAGETAVTIQLNGHTYYGFRDMAAPVGNFYLLCDPATGLAVGEVYDTTLIELWTVAVVDADGDMP
jgi:hypothetical protein